MVGLRLEGSLVIVTVVTIIEQSGYCFPSVCVCVSVCMYVCLSVRKQHTCNLIKTAITASGQLSCQVVWYYESVGQSVSMETFAVVRSSVIHTCITYHTYELLRP